jgi:4-hydroxybenzoate polyprenyltransferase
MDKPVKRKRVRVEFGKRRKPWLTKLFLFVSIAAALLLVFYLFSLAEYIPKK